MQIVVGLHLRAFAIILKEFHQLGSSQRQPVSLILVTV